MELEKASPLFSDEMAARFERRALLHQLCNSKRGRDEFIASYRKDLDRYRKMVEPGPWSDEPDFLTFEHSGLTCHVARTPHRWALCGYVGVPPGHPLYRVRNNQPSPHLAWAWSKKQTEQLGENPSFSLLGALALGLQDALKDPTVSMVLSVHGGINYSTMRDPGGYVGPQGLWWFAFDCAHAGDYAPADDATMRKLKADGIMPEKIADDLAEVQATWLYRPFDYVVAETKKLADELRWLASSCGFVPPPVAEPLLRILNAEGPGKFSRVAARLGLDRSLIRVAGKRRLRMKRMKRLVCLLPFDQIIRMLVKP